MVYKRLGNLGMLFAVAFIFAVGCAASFRYTKEFCKTYSVKPGITISVYNRNGDIDISKWDKDEIEVRALITSNRGKGELDKVEIEVSTDGDMEIRTKYLKKRARVSVDYEIKVPANVIVGRLESSNGRLDLVGTKGPSVLKTSNGRIDVEDAEGDIDAETSNGRIEIENVSGYVNARTSNGRIKITGTAGISRIRTSNGRIKVEIPDIKGDEVEIKTSNGSVDVYISPDLNADIELDTSNGKISLHDIKLEVSELKKTYVKGKLGEGGVRISVDTSNGNIKLYKL